MRKLIKYAAIASLLLQVPQTLISDSVQASPNVLTLQPHADGFWAEGSYIAEGPLMVSTNSNDPVRSALDYDLTTITGNISQARLRVYVNYVGDNDNNPNVLPSLKIYGLTTTTDPSAWGNYDLYPWDTSDVELILSPGTNQTVSSIGWSGYYDVTDFINRQKLSGKTHVTFIVGTDETMAHEFIINSMEDSEFLPELEITTEALPSQAPTVTNATTNEDMQSFSELKITPDSSDTTAVTHFKISNIVGGTLYQNDGTTPISNDQYITYYEGDAGLKFTPTSNLNSQNGDAFSFQVQSAQDISGTGLSTLATTASITVNQVNDAPTSVDDTLGNQNENTPIVSIPISQLLSNDLAGPSNENNQMLNLSLILDSAIGGAVALSDDQQNVIFTPQLDYHGPASFKYTVEDNGYTDASPDPLESNQATASFVINPVAHVPAVTNTSTVEDEQSMNGLVITRNPADGIEVTHFKISEITGGTLYYNDGVFPINEGQFIPVHEGEKGLKFKPASDANGTTGFGFKAQAALDGSGTGLSPDAAQASITVSEVNDEVVAVPDSLSSIPEDSGEQTFTFAELLANDSKGPANESGQTLQIVSVGNATGGTVRIDGTNVIFTPQSNFSGTASFEYTVEDDGTTNGASAPTFNQATVTFTIVDAADTPSVTNTETLEDTQSNTGLIITPNSADGIDVTHFRISQITGGRLYQNDGTTLIADGEYITVSAGGAGLKFTPTADANGTTGFGFIVQAALDASGTGLSSAAQANIDVMEVNDTPVGQDDVLERVSIGTSKVDIPFSLVTANDQFGAANELDQSFTITDVNAVNGGTVSIVNGQIEFVPDPSFQGTAKFTYMVSDNGRTNGTDDYKTATAEVQFDIVDTVKPVINLNGELTPHLVVGQSYIEPGYSANDNLDGDLTNNVTLTGMVDTATPGIYQVRYNVADSSGNTAVEVTRTIAVASIEPTLLTAIAGNSNVDLNWSPVPNVTGYKIYKSTASGSYGDEIASVDSSGTTYRVTGLSNGTTYYFTVKAVSTGGDSAASNELSSTPITVPAAPTDVSAVAGNGEGTITFHPPADNGGSTITEYEVVAASGTIVIASTGTASPIKVTGLTNGMSYTFKVKARNAAGHSLESSSSNAVTPTSPSSGGGGGPAPIPAPTGTTQSGVDVLVNGKVENAGTATTSQINKQSVTTVAVDQDKLNARLASEGQQAVITIPMNFDSEVVIGELNGQMVKDMAQKQAVVEIKTENATYTLPAQQINMDAISDQLGNTITLQDIKIRIEISKPTADTAKIVENSAAAGGFTIVAPAINFTVTGVYGDKTIEVSKFSSYVERTLAIPDGVDANKITTGVVVEPDGTVRQVPTKIVIVDGKYYAILNSLTNSTYSVVWHPIEFKDVAKHWAKSAVNDMGSRMIVHGNEAGLFNPNLDITRAEFTAIIVRGLGLKLDNSATSFSDVKSSAWYNSAIQTAHAYGLINGYVDGTFRPMDTITREQAMAIMSKAMIISGLKDKLPTNVSLEALEAFDDSSNASSWAKSAILDCLTSGIVTGRSDHTLAPKAHITRAEVAALIKKLLEKSDLI